MAILTTSREVIEALGGLSAVRRLLIREMGLTLTVPAILFWRDRAKKISKPESYPVMRRALEEQGLIADPAIWGFTAESYGRIVDTAIGLSEFYGTGEARKLFEGAAAAPARAARGSRKRDRRSRPSASTLKRDGQMRMQL